MSNPCFIDWGFDEDAAVIEHVKPVLTPVSQTSELFVETDGPEKAYRDKVARIGQRLGVIDWRRMQDLGLDRVQVIPSPFTQRCPCLMHKADRPASCLRCPEAATG
jgi:hypothetical protein